MSAKRRKPAPPPAAAAEDIALRLAALASALALRGQKSGCSRTS